MKDSLKPGASHTLEFVVSEQKTVPNLYPEASEFQQMPAVLATGFMVGLMEWACMKALEPHLEEGEGSLGVHVNVSHGAPTPPGMTVRVDAECISVENRRVVFAVSAHDGLDEIGKGEIQRFVVSWNRFNRGLEAKQAKFVAGMGADANG
ncbi:MAG: thioesterase family protein [Pseudomonadales bacterium]|nr:thioesterase family protein [Pseudomonadales bacterium]